MMWMFRFTFYSEMKPLTFGEGAALPVMRNIAVPLWPVRGYGDRVRANVLRVLWCGEKRPCKYQK